MKLQYKHTQYACYIGYITQAIVNNLAPLLFLTFQKEFAISLDKISLLIFVNFAFQILVDFLAAKYVDRIGYRPCMIFAHIFAVVGLVGFGIFPSLLPDPYLGLLLAILLNALGGGLLEVLVSPIVESLPNDEKSSAMSLLHSFYCWGHMGVVILSTLFFTTIGISNWRLLTALWAIVPLFNAFFFAKVPLNTLEAQEEAAHDFSSFVRSKLFWIFIVLMICSGASEQAMSQWSSLFAESGLKVSKTMGDLLGPCAFACLMGTSRAFYGKFGARISLQKFIIGSGFLCICSYLLATLSPFPLLSLVGCALCGLSVGIMWPGTFSLACEHCPGMSTAAFAMFALAGDLGCASGPALTGYVSSLFGENLKAGLLAALIFPILMLLFIRMLPKKAKA